MRQQTIVGKPLWLLKYDDVNSTEKVALPVPFLLVIEVTKLFSCSNVLRKSWSKEALLMLNFYLVGRVILLVYETFVT